MAKKKLLFRKLLSNVPIWADYLWAGIFVLWENWDSNWESG